MYRSICNFLFSLFVHCIDHLRYIFYFHAILILISCKHESFHPTISLEMPVPSQGHYGFHSFPTDFVCLYNYEFWLSLCKNCSEFGNFVITLIYPVLSGWFHSDYDIMHFMETFSFRTLLNCSTNYYFMILSFYWLI